MNILPNGSWDCETTEPHSFDESLCREIIHLFDGNEISSVCDMGCGAGQYVAELNEGGFVAVGIDGNPNTWKFNADCHQQDLSKPVAVGKFDAVLSLETGEHIPREFEHTSPLRRRGSWCCHGSRFPATALATSMSAATSGSSPRCLSAGLFISRSGHKSFEIRQPSGGLSTAFWHSKKHELRHRIRLHRRGQGAPGLL